MTKETPALDTELEDLPQELRWREWMGRIEAVIFASGKPVLFWASFSRCWCKRSMVSSAFWPVVGVAQL